MDPRIFVLHENQAWTEPLADALTAREAPFEEFWRSQEAVRREAEERFAFVLGQAPVVAWLEERSEGALAHAVAAHYTGWGVPHESLLDKALLACDELTGFVGACCHVRPGGITQLKPKSVLKKLKDKRFAAGVERPEVQAGAELLGVEIGDHIQFIIDALKPHAAELGLEGTGAS